MTLNEALDRVKQFTGGSCGWVPGSHPAVEAGARQVGLILHGEIAPQAWSLWVCADAANLTEFFQGIASAVSSVMVAVDLGAGAGPTRETCDRAAIGAGFRRYPGVLELVGYEEIEAESGWIVLSYQRVDPAVESRFPLGFLAANRDLHMDMTREAGRRSDAHLARYQFARTHLGGCARVLDAACGLGYGSAMLALDGAARTVLGVDIDPESIGYASASFGSPGRVDFREGNVCDFGALPSDSFDGVVSFETIEHIADPAGFLAEVRRLLRPEGLFVASVPYRWVKDGDLGPYHVDEYDMRKLMALCSRFLVVESVWTQTAGGGAFCPEAPRAMRRHAAHGAEPHVPAEWLVIVARRRELIVAKPRSAWVLLTPGLPQLATMVASLRSEGIPFAGAVIVGNSQVADPDFSTSMAEAAQILGCEYAGNLFNEPSLAEAGDPTRFEPDNADGRDQCGDRILRANPILGSLCGCRLVMTARANMPADYAIVAAIRPVELRLVTDGIQNHSIFRDFSGAVGFAHNALVRLPTNDPVFCTPWLELEASFVGRAHVIPEEICRAALRDLGSTRAARALAAEVGTGEPGFDAVVISQHFSRSGLTSEPVETVFYLHQLRQLLAHGPGRILFKAHPRDPAEKLAALAAAVGRDGRVRFTSGEENHVPLESLQAMARPGRKLTIWGTSSTALLGVRGWPGVDVSCVDADYLEAEVRRQGMQFAARHGISLLTLRFDDAQLGDTDRAVLRRSMVRSAHLGPAGMRDSAGDGSARAQLNAAFRERAQVRAEISQISSELRAMRVRSLAGKRAELASLHDRRIAIWGAGSGGRRLLPLLRGGGIRVAAVIDRDPSKAGTTIDGVPVITPPQDAHGLSGMFVLIATTYAAEVEQALAARGLCAAKDFQRVDFDEVAAAEYVVNQGRQRSS